MEVNNFFLTGYWIGRRTSAGDCDSGRTIDWVFFEEKDQVFLWNVFKFQEVIL